MKYISTSKLEFFLKSYMRDVLLDLKSAQLVGHFKEENFHAGQLFALKKISNILNLDIDIDKLKL